MPLHKLPTKLSCALLTVSMLTSALYLPAAQARLADTPSVLQPAVTQPARDHIRTLLQREDIKRGLQARGVDPAQVQARVDALSDAQARELAGQLDQLPAGGDGLEVLLLVFILLLITDLAGITHIFTFTHHRR